MIELTFNKKLLMLRNPWDKLKEQKNYMSMKIELLREINCTNFLMIQTLIINEYSKLIILISLFWIK